MSKHHGKPTNILGDVRAEQDIAMLSQAFITTPDYRSLLESSGQTVIVGRRGTGKSALTYALNRHWEKEKSAILFVIAPEEEQIISLRPTLRLLEEKVVQVRVAVKLAWSYAILLEISARLLQHYKAKSQIRNSAFLVQSLHRWNCVGEGVIPLVKEILAKARKQATDGETMISELMDTCSSQKLASALGPVLDEFGFEFVAVIDKLDEGYDHDTIGVGIVDGVIYGMHDFCRMLPTAKVCIFLRDNIYRTLASKDPDFSRNIEGCTIRLNWNAYQLFTLTTSRLRVAFGLDVENDVKLWNRCVAEELQGRSGFEKCLRKTLYRPRDLLHLLNSAFYIAAKEERTRIIQQDLDSAAQSISENRLRDLTQEYSAVFPGIGKLVKTFSAKSPSMTYEDVISCINSFIHLDNLAPDELQNLNILGNSHQVALSLYGVGFLGVQDKETAIYKFSHDGKPTDTEIGPGTLMLIHPCYWIALRLNTPDFSEQDAGEIYDEFEISISSETRERRNKSLGQLIAELDTIQTGSSGATDFEDWTLRTLKVLFAGKLKNIEGKPNANATQRRDIVATNMSDTPFWRRIYEDFGTRQVIFEVKNFDELGPDEYRQALSYSGGHYGKALFIVTRAKDNDLKRDKELQWFKEMHNLHQGVTIIKISARFLAKLLSKLRNPGKHDEVEEQFNKLLDVYTRTYLSSRADTASQHRERRRGNRK